jgi:hypothetical protein
VCVISTYKNRRLSEIDYYPSPVPVPRIKTVFSSLLDDEFVVRRSVERMKTELVTLLDALDNYSVDVVLLDGSIVPVANVSRSEFKEDFEEIVELTKEVYKKSKCLAGCCEDSRGRKLWEIVESSLQKFLREEEVEVVREIGSRVCDTVLLFDLLEKGERSFVFKYGRTPVTEMLGEFEDKVFSFYLKAGEDDRPLRIDFLCKNESVVESANFISSIVSFLSCTDGYTYPAPLVEADRIVKISNAEAQEIVRRIVEYSGIDFKRYKLRRENRIL